MENILIIGNGFDLYHGLPTRYSDFMFFATEFDASFYPCYENQSSWNTSEQYVAINTGRGMTKEILKEFGKHGHLLNAEHVKFLKGELKSNAWIRYFNSLEHKGMLWVDFENEIKNALFFAEEFFSKIIPDSVGRHNLDLLSNSIGSIVKIFGTTADLYPEKVQKDYRTDDINSYEEYFLNIAYNPVSIDKMELHLKKEKFISGMLKELEDLVRCLRYYLQDFVGAIKCDVRSEQIKALGNVDVLNFNYTNTYEKVYSKINFRQNFIHGGVAENNMVLGVPDDAFPDTTEYIRFQKYFQRIQKRTGSEYRNWLHRMDTGGYRQSVNVYIMGHSLGVADFGVLKEFFAEENSIKQVFIYYHDQNSYENLVINLVEALGKEFVIEQIGTGRVVFEELNPPVKIGVNS